MKEQDKKMVLPKLDDLFTSQEQRDNPVVDEVKEIELYKIGEFPDHPFRVIDDDKMEEMVKSVKEHGVLLPVIVRKRGEGNYQMISGLDLCQVFRHIFLRIFINFFKLRLRSCYKY